MARIKCNVCGLYRGAKPHSGSLHTKIMANRARFKRRLAGSSGRGLAARLKGGRRARAAA